MEADPCAWRSRPGVGDSGPTKAALRELCLVLSPGRARRPPLLSPNAISSEHVVTFLIESPGASAVVFQFGSAFERAELRATASSSF